MHKFALLGPQTRLFDAKFHSEWPPKQWFLPIFAYFWLWKSLKSQYAQTIRQETQVMDAFQRLSPKTHKFACLGPQHRFFYAKIDSEWPKKGRFLLFLAFLPLKIAKEPVCSNHPVGNPGYGRFPTFEPQTAQICMLSIPKSIFLCKIWLRMTPKRWFLPMFACFGLWKSLKSQYAQTVRWEIRLWMLSKVWAPNCTNMHV